LTPFLLAVAEENIDLTHLMLGSGKVDTNSRDVYGRSALHYAASNGNVQLVKLLIENGMNPNIMSHAGETPLMKACQFVELGTIEYLLSIPEVDIHCKNVVRKPQSDREKRPRHPTHSVQHIRTELT
jgi:ankyrin repeat protein